VAVNGPERALKSVFGKHGDVVSVSDRKEAINIVRDTYGGFITTEGKAYFNDAVTSWYGNQMSFDREFPTKLDHRRREVFTFARFAPIHYRSCPIGEAIEQIQVYFILKT